MSIKHQEISSSIGQSPGCDPKTSKRSSGIFSFFKWFKPATSHESVTQESSPSSSCDSLNSIASAGTIASFSFVLPTEYKTDVIEKNIVPGPETDTYRARLKQRDNRRERDKNVTLRKKYNLFFSRDTVLKTVKTEEDNSKSLPLMTRKTVMESEEKLHRRTNSESSKLRKSGAYCHVKGKRKAPQPPDKSNTSTMSLRRKKRLAPQPPAILTSGKVITSLLSADKYGTIEYADADVIFNDSLKLDHGILKPTKTGDAQENSDAPNKSPRASYMEAPVSPRPWYKRSRDTTHKKDKEEDRYEPISVYCKNITVNHDSKHKQKEDKRKSGMSFLRNISELDREASDIIKKEHVHEVLPECMRLKHDDKDNTDTWTSPKRRSAKDLIAKFNAITNVTKVTVNSAFFGAKESNAFQKDNLKRDYFGKPSVSTKQNKTEVDNSVLPNKNKIPPMKAESAAIIKPNKLENKEVFDKKSWFCPKCSLENDYWRIICYVCSTIKPYFDDLTIPPAKNNTLEKNKTQISEINHNPFSTSDTSKNTHQAKPATNVNLFERHLERSRTQIGFSALAKYNEKQKPFVKSSSVEEKPKQVCTDKQEERERLKKMLIEMKNSLPKRRPNPEKLANRSSVIQESAETVETDVEIQSQQENPAVFDDKVAQVTVATQETIYENIKIKKSAHPKPVKISSSVQTNSIINKSHAAVTAAAKKHTPNRNYELMRPKDFDIIYSGKIENNRESAYMNVAQTYDVATKYEFNKDVPNTDTLEINRLLKRLEIAIAKGELNEASNMARDLAQLKVNCSVIRQKSVEGAKKNSGTVKGFVVNVYVEDKVSHRGPFPIRVHQDLTIQQLKKQTEEEFNIPTAVQRWIIGKELLMDDNATLKELKITTEGCPLFLYLVAPGKETQIIKESASKKENAIIQNEDTASTSKSDITNNGVEHSKRKEHIAETIKDANKPDIQLMPNLSNITGVVCKTDQPQSKEESRKLQIHKINVMNPEKVPLKENQKQNARKSEIPLVMNEIFATTSQVVVVINDAPNVHQTSLNKEPTAPINILANNDEIDDYDSKTLKPQKNLWECIMCTFLNPQNSNICVICATVQRITTKSNCANAVPQKQELHYQQLINLDNADLVENIEVFECLVCLTDIPPRYGITLRECLHQFCKICLIHTIEYNDEAEVKCPYRDNVYSCDLVLQDREIKALLTPTKYEQFLAKSVAQAENKIDKSFHCKTPDCKGWCIFEDNVNEFHCPVCRWTNCLTCQAIHVGLNCKQYQESINQSSTDENSKRTKEMLEEMVNKGEAIKCPTCQVILMKKWGCDWLRCSMCKTEICWVTRGPRWGPAGKGDTSGGCRCGVNAIKCHPKCNYCH